MNDDFLTRFRKHPPQEFSEALYERINAPMNTQSKRGFRSLMFAGALCAALFAALVFSPTARAALNGWVVEIDGMTFFEPDESASQATPLPESQMTIVPEEILPLAEAQAKLPYEISLPVWVPDGFKMSSTVRISHFPGGPPPITIVWHGSDPIIGNIELMIFGQQVQWVVDSDDVQEVEVNGQPAAWIGGTWDAETGHWNNQSEGTLSWMRGETMYRLSSPGAAIEDLIRMAESIP